MGRPISVTIPHKLGKQEARRRIQDEFGSVQRNMTAGWGALISVEERWEGDRLHFGAGGLGQKIHGQLDVLAESVQIEIEMPELLAAVANRILSAVKAGTQKLLDA
jgi:hypothetical protein